MAEVNGRIVGGLGFNGGERVRIRHTGEFGVTVSKDSWGVGIGTKLIEALIDWAKKHRTCQKNQPAGPSGQCSGDQPRVLLRWPILRQGVYGASYLIQPHLHTGLPDQGDLLTSENPALRHHTVLALFSAGWRTLAKKLPLCRIWGWKLWCG